VRREAEGGRREEVTLGPSRKEDLAFITELERHPENRELIGQWSDEEHLRAIEGRERWSHWIIEESGRPAGYIIPRDCEVAWEIRHHHLNSPVTLFNEAKAFADFMQKANDVEKSHLRLEVEKLRRSEGECDRDGRPWHR